jgi:CBS domain-containing protein
MKVSEIMTKNVASIQSDEPASAAAQLMWDRDCGAIPVTEGGRVVGMITDRDICMSSWSKNTPPNSLRASDAMSKALYYCSPSDDVADAESIMRNRQIRRVPVLDEQRRLLGILSLADVARAGDSGARSSLKELGSNEVALTLATICRPGSTASS